MSIITPIIAMIIKVAERVKEEPKPRPTMANHAEPTLHCPVIQAEEPDWYHPCVRSDYT